MAGVSLFADVAPGVHRVEDAHTNWYLIEDAGRLTIVDTGVPSSWRSLQAVLPQLGRRVEDVEAIVLTHAHFDHIVLTHAHFDHLGFAERVRRELRSMCTTTTSRSPGIRGATTERARARYLTTQVRAMPIVATFLAHRALWPSPVNSVTLVARAATADVERNPHLPRRARGDRGGHRADRAWRTVPRGGGGIRRRGLSRRIGLTSV